MRRFVVIATWISAILCVALIAMWVRSHYASDGIVSRVRGPRAEDGRALWWGIETRPGKLGFTMVEQRPSDDAMDWQVGTFAGTDGPMPKWRSVELVSVSAPIGKAIAMEQSQGGGASMMEESRMFVVRSTFVAIWIPLLMMAVLPVLMLLARRRRLRSERWAAEGRCFGCGYDLRASPERCPECGKAVFSPTEAAGPPAGART